MTLIVRCVSMMRVAETGYEGLFRGEQPKLSILFVSRLEASPTALRAVRTCCVAYCSLVDGTRIALRVDLHYQEERARGRSRH